MLACCGHMLRISFLYEFLARNRAAFHSAHCMLCKKELVQETKLNVHVYGATRLVHDSCATLLTVCRISMTQLLKVVSKRLYKFLDPIFWFLIIVKYVPFRLFYFCYHCFRAISFFLSFFLSSLHYEKTAGPICLKFSRKVWSDSGTT